MFWTVAILVIAALLGLYVVLTYNGLVALRQKVAEGFSGIDVQLKRRSSLIPNLVETVKGYMAHERQVLEQVTRSRQAADDSRDLPQRAAAEARLGAALGQLFALAEAYPDLKASRNFQDLHASLEATERDIQHARRYYNGAVRMLNIKVQSFPSNLIARQFGFAEAGFFELDAPSERDLPKVDF